MAAQPNTGPLTLKATSAAEDLGFVSIADLSAALPDRGDFRLIGGHMVALHVHRWQLGAELYRETADSDLGATTYLLADGALVARLEATGYHQVAGDRWERNIDDVPAAPGGVAVAAVDLLIPAYQSHARQNVAVNEQITAIEVPGLPDALNRPPVVVDLRLIRLNGQVLETRAQIPDEAAALGLKAFAWSSRRADKDAADLWRCLEIAHAAGVGPADLAGGRLPEAVEILRSGFRRPDGPALVAMAKQQSLSAAAATARGTRLAALISSVAGTGPA